MEMLSFAGSVPRQEHTPKAVSGGKNIITPKLFKTAEPKANLVLDNLQ